MNLQLIQGEFSARDAQDLMTQLVQVKINYHEAQIVAGSNEEDMKFRESKIKRLQDELAELRKTIGTGQAGIKLDGTVTIG